MARSSWEGFLRFSLISIPVRAHNSAAPAHGEIHFHQLHRGCGERIQYKKVCPIHGEVSKEDILSGYEVNKGEYVEIEPDEIKNVRAEDDESISIDAFLKPEAIDPVYYSGKTFYLVPNGAPGQKAYALLTKVMAEQKVEAVAHMVLSGHEAPVLIRAVGAMLEMTVLFYESQVKGPASVGEEIAEPKISAQELKLAKDLVEESTVAKYDFSKLKDHYTERVSELIESKTAGKPVRKAKREKHPPVINLMEALKKSLKEAHGSKNGTGRAVRHRKTG
ncbi:MAG TPA: Ku protein [Gemmataceae bacterium]|nr:Ku protein [Gemmataceae bacterium]